MSYGRLAPSAALLDDASPIEAFFPATLETWFAGSHVTVDGRPTDRPLMVFRGCAVGDELAQQRVGQVLHTRSEVAERRISQAGERCRT